MEVPTRNADRDGRRCCGRYRRRLPWVSCPPEAASEDVNILQWLSLAVFMSGFAGGSVDTTYRVLAHLDEAYS